jgi:mono/diheme cytochrome c family protein
VRTASFAPRGRPFGLPRLPPWGATTSIALLALSVGLLACDSAPRDRREWVAADHDQPEGRTGQTPQAPSQATNDRTLVDLAWQKNCAQCHGARGRGDGPQAAMARPPDLTRRAWQERVTDAQIADVIRNGKNKMPKFDLPPPVVEGLVARIRAEAER